MFTTEPSDLTTVLEQVPVPTEVTTALEQVQVATDWMSLIPNWISAVSSVLMLVVTLISVYYAYRAYKHQKDRSRKEAACNLAKYYANNIIDKYTDIAIVFDNAGIMETIRNTFPLDGLKDFDREELELLLKDKGMAIADFEEKLRNLNPMSVLNARMSRACSPEERNMTFTSYTKVGEDGKTELINGTYLLMDFEQEISGLLNELEWFAMNCKYGLADEELMYQSLHQTFISTVWMLYFYISHRNVNNEDKLYTNLVWLFVAWRDRLSKIKNDKEAEREEYLQKANSVKAKVYEGTSLK